MHKFAWIVVAFLAQAQTAPAPAFEVASVRLTQHGRGPDGWSHSSLGTPSPGNFVTVNESLQGLIRFAYNVNEYQVAGPEWLNSDEACYDISAKASPDTPHDQIQLMVRTLLAERFELVVHNETRTVSGYNLVVAKNGPKELTPAAQKNSTSERNGQVTATGISMTEGARQLSRHLHQPVFDKTGLEGYFDFKMDYPPD